MQAAFHPVGDSRHIPEAWPLLLSRDQLCAYMGGISWATLSRICPVHPIDLGANLLRYPRLQIDAWIASLPPRLPGRLQDPKEDGQDAPAGQPPPADPTAPEDRRSAAVDRARARAGGGSKGWKRAS